MRSMGTIIDNYAIPHPAPEPVEKLSAEFEKVAAEYRAAQKDYYGRVSSRLDDIRHANQAAAAARIRGEKITVRTEAKIDADIAKAKTEMEMLAEATDMLGTELAQLVRDHAEEWAATLDAADDEATERLATQLKLVQQAEDDIAMARGAATWLRSSRATQYPGSSGHTASDYERLTQLVTGVTRLVGYREGEPIFETKKVVRAR